MNVDSNTEPRLQFGAEKSASGSDPQHHPESITEKDVIEKGPNLGSNIDGSLNLRSFVRLFQCEICHKILRQPLTLPCGETLCRSCLPSIYERQNISYPKQPNRRKGFVCPFRSCEGQEHSLADCNPNITLANILTVTDAVLSSDVNTSLDANQDIILSDSSLLESSTNLLEVYTSAKQGLLHFDSDFLSQVDGRGPLSKADLHIQRQLLVNLLCSIRPELDCQVCYCLLRLPITTSCGHTFCESCLRKVRDHSNLCPFCRRSLSPYQSTSEPKASRRLRVLSSNLFPHDVATRDEQAAEDAQNDIHHIPIFACAMTFPGVPMFLHIFEPRYRAMLRKVINDGSRSFGMVSHRQGAPPSADGDFDAPFARYGTMLYVTNLQMFPDGRSLIETTGTYRFKILSYIWQDGYPMAKVERIEDIAYADEENMEAAERMLNTTPIDSISLASLSHLSTQELHQQGLEFVNTMRNDSTGWFTDRVLNTYGQPPQDPAIFPFWVATLLPVHEREKYLVLVSTSVRERLKLVMVWIRSMQQRSWLPAGGLGGSCIIS
ncbi:hypothetical protein TWF730_010760 [Orbilia blumenaviensis]|uniref:LON peptidase N-terminal domain and RING finger protein 1 n=1 Tax=Orbilia blumenaviensis TaxID=1796055 RepID=A0AAV9UQR3_9PEZI